MEQPNRSQQIIVADDHDHPVEVDQHVINVLCHLLAIIPGHYCSVRLSGISLYVEKLEEGKGGGGGRYYGILVLHDCRLEILSPSPSVRPGECYQEGKLS